MQIPFSGQMKKKRPEKREAKEMQEKKPKKGEKREEIVSKEALDTQEMPSKRIKKCTRNKSLKLKVQKLIQVRK